MTQQATNTVAMVKPTEFNLDLDGITDNFFIKANKGKADKATLDRVWQEFNGLVKALKDHGIRVKVYDSPRGAPDAIFPNNWISVHWETILPAIVLYPMKAPKRRLERQSQILIDLLLHPPVGPALETIDLTEFERGHYYLESTGSLVLDRVNLIAYYTESERTHPELAPIWAEKLNYKYCAFKAKDEKGRPIYHTNILMALGQSFAILCLEAIPDPKDKKYVTEALTLDSHREIIEITMAQMKAYCGNCLQLCNQEGKLVLFLSKTAYNAFTPQQRALLSKHNDGGLVAVDYETVENLRGGSVRCSLLELFPRCYGPSAL